MDSSPEAHLPIPRSYKVLKLLGEGGFGKVVECVKRGSTQTVAIKIGTYGYDLSREASVMKDLMRHHMDNFNIVKFHGKVKHWGITSLVFEKLDISLQDYLVQRGAPMCLEDIRSVTQQMATALHGLESMGVIHTDVKIDNIMLVDHMREPLEVKLIDFGLALKRSKARPGMNLQTPQYRCPEILLGLPFAEAIDIWSLGCVMEMMMLGFMLFPGRNDYDVLRFIIDLLGPPADYLLNAGMRSKEFFKKTDSDQWTLKTPDEYWGSTNFSTDNRPFKFRSLETLKLISLEEDNQTEADERRECVELLRGMHTWDGRVRMSPHDILNHPFITQSYLSSCNGCQESVEPSTSQSQTWTSTDTDYRDSVPCGVILVQPAAPMNQMHMEETTDQDTDMRDSVPCGVTLVQPAAPRNQMHLDETSDQDTDMRDSLASGVITVQPAAPVNQMHLDDEDREKSPKPSAADATVLDSIEVHPDSADLPPTPSDKKKKNCLRRFLSWMRRTVCSCCTKNKH